MSIAVGLSFTGCGNSNSSSNGGSTGPTFEQVPLIGDNYLYVNVQFPTDDGNNTGIDIVLNRSGEFSLRIMNEIESKYEDFSGSWRATQSSNNTYQIELSNIRAKDGCTCDMTCNAPLILTIPEDNLEDYRQGQLVFAPNLLKVNFSHTPSSSCKITNGTQAIQSQGVKLGYIKQGRKQN
ncbi:MAG: hypothetical protein ACI4OX_06310 [Akkermansia sp.]